jgi:hypothetical protein
MVVVSEFSGTILLGLYTFLLPLSLLYVEGVHVTGKTERTFNK